MIRFYGTSLAAMLLVVRYGRILYEAYGPDFGSERPHPMSTPSTTLNLMLGRAVADGLIDVDERVGTYLPEIGTGYAEATIKAVADMNVANDFIEDYSDGGASGPSRRPYPGCGMPPKVVAAILAGKPLTRLVTTKRTSRH
ncbi:hypothetical protein [Mesorhizobium caraganae]|uniref:hypothetical protein n=1 Tax=Mesorhizobium caraganae TaxID=483206 RepID=UPI001783CAF7|nr:hypothetical protein [Mesorhizobium caraganae]